LHQSRSRYEFTAQAQFRPQLRWQAQIQAVDAAIEDLVPALMTGVRPGAEALAVTPVGEPNLPLGEQLAYFHRVQVQVQQYLTSQQKALGLPDVQELRGRWQGQATLQGNHRGELMADFDLRGRNWVWGPYQAERLTLQGRYEGTLQGGRWTLQPLQLVQGPSQVLFTGMIGGALQTGQLLITQIPAEYITRWLPLPGLEPHLNPPQTHIIRVRCRCWNGRRSKTHPRPTNPFDRPQLHRAIQRAAQFLGNQRCQLFPHPKATTNPRPRPGTQDHRPCPPPPSLGQTDAIQP